MEARFFYKKGNKNHLLFLIILLGFLLRIYNLGQPSLWNDEACTFERVNGSFSYTLSTLRTSPFPPFYYFIMSYWTKLFGYSEISLRFPSLLFSTLSLIFIFCLCRELFNEKIGLISAFLLSISPYAINYAQEAKQYSMMWFLSILTFYYFVRYLKSNKISFLVCYILSLVFSIYTLYMGFLFLVVQNILFFTFFKGGKIKTWFIAQGAIILFYLPWAANALVSVKNIYGIGWIKHPESYRDTLIESFRMFLGDFIFSARNYLNTIEVILFVFLLVVPGIYLLLSFFPIRPKIFGLIGKKELGLVVIWWLMPIFFYFLIDKTYTPIFVSRYLGYSHIPILVLVSVGIFIVGSFLKRSHYLILGTLLIIIFYAHLLPYYKNGLKIENADWRGLIQELCTRTSEKSLTILGFHAARPTLYYGKCLKGTISSVSNYEIKPENESVFILQEGKNFMPQASLIKQQGFIAREELHRGVVCFLGYEFCNKRGGKNEVRNTLNRFIKTLKEKINQDDLILIHPVSEFCQYFKTNNLIDLDKFIEKHGEDRKYYKNYESIFIVYEDNINQFVPFGYLLKEKYVLYLTNGGEEVGYFWYKRIR